MIKPVLGLQLVFFRFSLFVKLIRHDLTLAPQTFNKIIRYQLESYEIFLHSIQHVFVLFMVHLFEIMFISYIRQFLICLFGLQIGAGGFLLHFDLFLACFFYPFLLKLNTSICYLKLFELFLFCNDELMDSIILKSESS